MAATAMTGGQRVGLVVPSLRGGGLERVVRDLALELQHRGDVPAVFAVDGLGEYAESLTVRGIAVHDCSEGRLRIRGIPRRLISALRGFHPDVIHAHSGTWLPAVVSRLVLPTRPRLVYTEHGRYPPEPARRAMLERWLARQTAQIVAVSDSVADYLARFLSLPERPLVIANGIDLAPYAEFPRPATRSELRRSWGIDDGAIVVTAVGRLAAVKNHAGMLRAFKLAHAKTPSLRLVLIGTGPLEAQLRQHATDLDLGAAVVFGGYRRDIPDCLAACDLWLCASDTEGLPIALLEALAAGLAIVSYDVGGIATAAGAAARIVPKGDETSLSNALVDLARDSAVRQKLQSEARARAFGFSLGTMTDAYRAAYHGESGLVKGAHDLHAPIT